MADQENVNQPTVYESLVHSLNSLNQEYTLLIESEENIVSVLRSLKSEASILTAALKQINTTRDEKRDKVFHQHHNESSYPLSFDDDEEVPNHVLDDVKQQELELNRLEEALFCDDLDSSSDDSISSDDILLRGYKES